MPDKYTYPGTEVLINFLGIKDQALLDRTEQNLAGIGLVELHTAPVLGSFNFSHLQAIHRRLVGDLYEWAGELTNLQRRRDLLAPAITALHKKP